MRNRFGILSETYSYLPFADRVATNRRFLEEVLGYAHANATRADGRRPTPPTARRSSASGCRCARRWRAAPQPVEILMGEVEEDVNPYTGRVMHKRHRACGSPSGWPTRRRSSRPSRSACPTAYFVPAEEKARGRTAARARHRARAGAARRRRCRSRSSRSPRPTTTPKPFENHQERTVTGKYAAGRARGAGRRLPRGDDAAAGAAGLLPARAALERRPGHLERARRGDEDRTLADPADAATDPRPDGHRLGWRAARAESPDGFSCRRR